MFAKELQTGHHLNWYDYGARYYDPSLARWTTPDPLTEWYFNNSPYNYVKNNPILFFDLFGLKSDSTNNVLPDGTPVFTIDEICVKVKKTSWIKNIFRKLWKYSIPIDRDGKSIVYKKYAEPWTFSVGQGRDNTIAKEWGPGGNIDLLLSVNPNAGRFQGKNPLNFANGVIK